MKTSTAGSPERIVGRVTMHDPTFGDVDDTSRPLAVLVHGFPDTPHTWRHLGPVLADAGYRVVATWLPGYRTAASGPVSVGTYVRHVLDVRNSFGGDDRAVLVGHDWGANAGYGAVVSDPTAFRRFVALAVPPTAALGSGLFGYRQLKRSFYIWFSQQVGLAESAFLEPGFWEGFGPIGHQDMNQNKIFRCCESTSMSAPSAACSVRIAPRSIRSSSTTPPSRTRWPRSRNRRCRPTTCTDPRTAPSVRNCSATSPTT
jgi:pimeloyl-ACP methyl ester carboxylesterase